MRHTRSIGLAAALAALAALTSVGVAAPDKLRRKEIKALEKQASKAAGNDQWDEVADLIGKLAAANKKKVYKFMSSLARRAPESSRVGAALVKAAEVMDDRRVKKEVLKDLEHHRSISVRRGLVGVFAKRKDWKVVIKALEDPDEEVSYVAAWHLTENRVEQGVEPMIAAMEKLDKTQAGVWYELRHLLGRLLGKKLNSGAEYRSWWTTIKKEKGGLKGVVPRKPGEPDPNEGGATSARRFFGRSIDSNRVVFILDVSGSMDKVDRPPRGAVGGRVGGSTGRGPKAPRRRKGLLNRLQRAQKQLKKVLEQLPDRTRINIITFSSKDDVKIWRDKMRGGEPPILHALNKSNRADAIKFVDGFRALGATATDAALIKAYSIKGARCFYLLSDGAPTHGGRKIIPTEEILDIVRKYDDNRHIRINTLGFKGAKKDMMQALAAGTGGAYSDIPPQ